MVHPLKSFQFDFSLIQTKKKVLEKSFHEILLFGKLAVPKWGLNAEKRFLKLLYSKSSEMIPVLVLLPGLQERETENKKYLHGGQFVTLTENVIANKEGLPWFVHG